MTSQVIEGHVRSFLCLKIHFSKISYVLLVDIFYPCLIHYLYVIFLLLGISLTTEQNYENSITDDNIAQEDITEQDDGTLVIKVNQ